MITKYRQQWFQFGVEKWKLKLTGKYFVIISKLTY